MAFKNIINIETIDLQKGEGVSPYEYQFNRPATAMGAKKLGFNIATIPPGQFSCPYHFHHSEEELFLVLEGKAMLRQASHSESAKPQDHQQAQYQEVSKGDLIFFQTGPEGAHQLYNHTKEICKILAKAVF